MTTSKKFFEAIEYGNMAAIEAMLDDNPHLIDEVDEHGLSPLMRAVMLADRDIDCISALVRRGADVNAKTRDGLVTALHWAMTASAPAGEGEEPRHVVRALVDGGADLEARDVKGYTPLMIAVASMPSTVEVVEALLAAGANPDVSFSQTTTPEYLRGRTLLMGALSHPDAADVVAALIRAGADISKRDVQGQTVLEFARDCLKLVSDLEDNECLEYKKKIEECIAVILHHQ